MKAISTVTGARVKGFLEGFIEALVTRYKQTLVTAFRPVLARRGNAQTSRARNSRPFHAAIIPEELLRMKAFARSLRTGLGTTFEECARVIAVEHHRSAQRGYRATAAVSDAAYDEVGRQRDLYDHAARTDERPPSFYEMIASVLDARRTDDLTKRTVTADLHIVCDDGTEHFFEIKSPKPNKGQCLEITERLLRFHLIAGQGPPAVQAHFAMAYNPYGPLREDYKHGYTLTYMPFEQAVLIGDEFWSVIGGPSTYKELLGIYQAVGREKTKYMIDALGFGF